MAKHRKHGYKTPEARAGHRYNESAKHHKRESEGMKHYWAERKHEGHGHRHSHHDMARHRDMAHHHRDDRHEDSSQLYHKGRAYYGPGYGEPSNLPMHPIHHDYPKAMQDLRTEYPDTLDEIDRDMEDSFHKIRAHESDSMY